jgi:hypothetical protein
MVRERDGIGYRKGRKQLQMALSIRIFTKLGG